MMDTTAMQNTQIDGASLDIAEQRKRELKQLFAGAFTGTRNDDGDATLVTKVHDRWYMPGPNKACDLEKLLEKALLKVFQEYKDVKKKLKVFRLEAVRAGFKNAWQERDYAVIVTVADKIPNNILEEYPKLLMGHDQTATRMGGE